MKNKILHLTIVLFFVTLFSGVIVGSIYYLLEPTIAEVEQKRLEDATRSVYGDGVEAGEELSVESKTIDKVYPITEDGEKIGYLLQLNAPESYSGTLNILVGIDLEGKVVDVGYLTMQETFTEDVKTDESYNEQFPGYTGDTDLDTISGVTVSSGSVIKGVNLALDYYEQYLATEGE